MSTPSLSSRWAHWPSLTILATLIIAIAPTVNAVAQPAQPRDAGTLRMAAPIFQSTTDSSTAKFSNSADVRANQPCVLLKNDNVLFGTAYQLGEYVVVRTGPEDELRLARSEVACWAPSLPDLYRYRLDQRTKPDLQARLRDARWCMQYDLLDEAAKELIAAKAIAPNHRDVRLLQGQLQRRREPPKPAAPIRTASFSETAPTADVGTANRIDPMILKVFASEVQPALINRCGRCHNQASSLPWRMIVPTAGSRPTAPTTRENLAAALKFVDGNDPQQSKLLIMATSPHGGGDAPLGVRNAKAIQSLRRWLSMSAGSLSGSSQPARGLGNMEHQSTAKPTAPESALAQVSYESAAPITSPAPIKTANESNQPQRLPTIANPFDPSLFNRRFHRQTE